MGVNPSLYRRYMPSQNYVIFQGHIRHHLLAFQVDS